MYEKLLEEARGHGITVIERYPFESPRIRGLCCDGTIAISEQVETNAERTVVLCEELAHALTSYGNILEDKQMERRTRERSFDRLIGIKGLLLAYLEGCRESWEFADRFGVPPEFFDAAMQNYRERYGTMKELTVRGKRYLLTFEPYFSVRACTNGQCTQPSAQERSAI